MPINLLVQEKILDFEHQGIPEVFVRELCLSDIQEPNRGNLAQVIVGTRRCGKTYRLFQEMHDLVAAGYDFSRMLYFNFEDERLKPYTKELLSDVVDTFYALHPSAREDGAFLFFDEIQEVPEWGLFLRRLIDSSKVTVYVTGSSSRMLSTELGSEFRGRCLSREMFPLSFSEYVRYTTGRRISRQDAYSADDQALLRNTLDGYLTRGGYIAPLGISPVDGVSLLQEYAFRTVALDVVERYNLRSPLVASAFVSRCLASSGRELSINKVFNEFKSRGVSTSRESLSNLLRYFEQAYLVFPLNELSRSLSDNTRSSSKVYASDPGMFVAFSRAAANEAGQRLETAVFNKLRRLTPSVRAGSLACLRFEHEGRAHEIDFVAGDALLGDVFSLVQVSIRTDAKKTRDRELSALAAGMERFGLGEAALVTLDERETIKLASGTVRVEPAWSWLLDEA